MKNRARWLKILTTQKTVVMIRVTERTNKVMRMAPRERFELPRFAPAVFETAALPGWAISA